MTLHGLSNQFLAATTTDQQWVSKAQIYTAKGVLLQDISEFVTGGTVTVDETAEIRRTCSVTLQGTSSLVPYSTRTTTATVGSSLGLLHPASGNELWMWRGIKYPNGSEEFAQLGVFRLTKPVWTDDGATITATINGQDRASVVARISWQKPYIVYGGTQMGTALQTALSSIVGKIYPNLNYSQMPNPNTFLFPVTTWGADPSQSSDPMSDMITFAATAGCELFFDVFGNPVFRLIVDPTMIGNAPNQNAANFADSIHFVEGENCTMESLSRTLDESTAFNGVILYCNGLSTQCSPFNVKVWDTNPTSPTNYLGPWGQVPFIITTTQIPGPTDDYVTAQNKAVIMAQKQLQLNIGAFEDLTFTTVPNPALREGDVVVVTRERMNVDDNYVIAGMTIPLDPTTDMSITCRPHVDATQS